MVEIYNYIERLPKSFADVFRQDVSVCKVECFGFKWYFDVRDVNIHNRFEYLVESIKTIETKENRVTNKNLIRLILDKSQSCVINYLLQVVDHLLMGYLKHQIQYTPSITAQIDDGAGRNYWRVFHTLGFKNIQDFDFLKIINDPVLFHWSLRNIAKDSEEEFEKWKTLQFFVNPEMYRDVYKEKELGREMEEKIKVLTEKAKATKAHFQYLKEQGKI